MYISEKENAWKWCIARITSCRSNQWFWMHLRYFGSPGQLELFSTRQTATDETAAGSVLPNPVAARWPPADHLTEQLWRVCSRLYQSVQYFISIFIFIFNTHPDRTSINHTFSYQFNISFPFSFLFSIHTQIGHQSIDKKLPSSMGAPKYPSYSSSMSASHIRSMRAAWYP